MFYHCYNLTSINIPNSIVQIAEHAFERCESLTSLNIPNSVGFIGKYAFDGCYALSTINIPNSVTTIDNFAFWHCNSLKTVFIGSNIENINTGAFADIELEDVYCYAKIVPTTNYNAFVGTNIQNATLHVPAEAIESYKNTSPWSNFGSIVNSNGKCEQPTICYEEGQLRIYCDTEDAEFITEISDDDIKTHMSPVIDISATYHISVFARKKGYEDSDIVTATLCWITQEPSMDGIGNSLLQIESVPALIQNHGNSIIISGIKDGIKVNAFTISGKQIASTEGHNGQASIATNLSAGSVVIVKIGDKAVKVLLRTK